MLTPPILMRLLLLPHQRGAGRLGLCCEARCLGQRRRTSPRHRLLRRCLRRLTFVDDGRALGCQPRRLSKFDLLRSFVLFGASRCLLARFLQPDLRSLVSGLRGGLTLGCRGFLSHRSCGHHEPGSLGIGLRLCPRAFGRCHCRHGLSFGIGRRDCRRSRCCRRRCGLVISLGPGRLLCRLLCRLACRILRFRITRCGLRGAGHCSRLVLLLLLPKMSLQSLFSSLGRLHACE